ncbi:hypothetical protein LIER_30499 [Lithospermum erythrorhizon]|uniref:Retrovirus-related Pol polyprotein from transposon TNT 1-94-like beta-barrel domain-containing protein n=1 Tax=Lithospermum erythrorhizon TaxID=34254 RepID=A0AAV3RPQ3_LITER
MPNLKTTQSYCHGVHLSIQSLLHLADVWYPDSGASSHMVGNLSLLQYVVPYYDSQQVMVGNGTLLPISHIGTSSLKFDIFTIILNHVLVVSNLTKNKIYIQRLCLDNYCIVQFSSSHFVLKDPKIMKPLIQCSSRGSIYPLIVG